VAARPRTTARVAALAARRGLPDLGRLAPSGRSIVCGLAILLIAVGGYFAARDTSMFAVRTLDVRGGTPGLRRQVEAALAGELGRSLLRVDGATLDERLSALPGVKSFSYDRAFPHTLRIVVRGERAVLIVRQGNRAFLVAASGRVLRSLANPRVSRLPRLYVKRDVTLTVGGTAPRSVVDAASALAAIHTAAMPTGVRFVVAGPSELTLLLASRFEVRLGDRSDVRLKLAIARRILQATGAATSGHGYLDVAVPERPVLDTNSQVGG
jgi:cell division septal protein FtsQ